MSAVRRSPQRAALVAIALAAATTLHAQRASAPLVAPVSQGVWSLGGSLSWSTNENAAGAPRTNRFVISPSATYTVLPHLALGMGIDVERAQTTPNTSQIWAIGPSATYYFGGAGSTFFPYLSANARFARNINDVEQANGSTRTTTQNLGIWTGSVGVLGMLSRQVGVFGEGYATAQTGSQGIANSVAGQVRSDILDRNAFGVRFGVRSFILP